MLMVRLEGVTPPHLVSLTVKKQFWFLNTSLREGCTNENPEKVWSFAKGGGGSRRVVKCQTSILEKYFFQLACRIILGPPKHVLHLV